MKKIILTVLITTLAFSVNAQIYTTDGKEIDSKNVGEIYIADTLGVFQWNDKKQKMVQKDIKLTPTKMQINHKEWLIMLGDKIYKIINRKVENDGESYTCLDKSDNVINVFISTGLDRIVVGIRMQNEQYVKLMMYLTGITKLV